MDPFELERRPDSDQEVGLGAEEGGEESERERVEGLAERSGGGEEEGELREEEREPDGEEGGRFEVEGIEDVGDHEADG